ncbi:MAG: hypothetical protein IJH34_03905 [Romboutsia sp.]|nr:hypothetical protein [Romboutsia sp.]
MTKGLIGLKKFIDDLVAKEDFHMEYPSIRQAYLRGSLNSDLAKFIVEKQKPSSTSYYVEEEKAEAFKEALLQYFTRR